MRRLRGRDGLTMLEVLVALAILTVGIAGVLHAFSASMAANREAETFSKASLLANRVASALERESSLSAGPLSGEFEDEPKYRWEANVEGEDANGMIRTSLRILWDEGTVTKNFDMVFYLSASSGES